MCAFFANRIAWSLLVGVAAVIAAPAAQPPVPALPQVVRIESKGSISFYAVSPDGRTVAYGEHTVRERRVWSELVLIDSTSGRELRRSIPVRGSLRDGVFSADGKSLALALPDRCCVWEVAECKERYALNADSIPLAFSPDGKLLVGVCKTGELTVWEPASGAFRCLKEEPKKKDPGPAPRIQQISYDYATEAKAVALADDGKPYLFVEHHGTRGNVWQWDLVTGKRLSSAWPETYGFTPAAEPMQRQATQGRNLPGSPVANLRFRAAPSGQVLVLPRYKVLAVAAVPYPDGTIAVVAVIPGSNPYPGSKEKELSRLREFQDTTHRSCLLCPNGNRLVAVGIDPKTARTRNPKWVLIVWDVSQLHGVAASKPKRPSDDELGSCWGRLAAPGLDGPEDFLRAMFTLASFPEESVPFLKNKVGPPADLKPIPGLIKDLDNSEFPARSRATRELERLGQVALPYLEKARVKPASAEAAKRIEQLVRKLQAAAMTDELRYLRIIDILEHVNTPAARELLQTIAGGGYGPAYAAAANAALQRKLPE